MTAIVKLKSGEKHRIDGYASEVVTKINAARCGEDGELVELKQEAIPAGQSVWIDAGEVESIVSERRGF